jgi:GT2 family glycosyltransferase
MADKISTLDISIRRFDEAHYVGSDIRISEDIAAGLAESALDHYLRIGMEENKYPLLQQEAVSIAGGAERFLVSESGHCLILGWLGDEGCDESRFKLVGSGFTVDLPSHMMIRHARADVEASVKSGAYDYGFIFLGKSPARSILKQNLLLQVTSPSSTFQAPVSPEIVSNKRLLDTVLELIFSVQAHAGKETAIYSFLSGAAGRLMIDMFRTHVADASAGHVVKRFGARPVSHSLVTVLFGSTEPMMIQPILFRDANVDCGEWIYVCNSPEDAETVLRQGELISKLYDVMITVIILGDNVGFGAANNIAVGHAASDRIFVINPDVYPVPAYAALLQKAFSTAEFGSSLWGGLLFYDDHNLMHSGMHFKSDTIVRRNSLNRTNPLSAVPLAHAELLRVEHFDKGVPFREEHWRLAKQVPAITGALMAFDKRLFEQLDGFSTRYIYGHYEDADLSIRWADRFGPVMINPDMRLVHLEGQGSRPRGDNFRGAYIANRYFFTALHEDRLKPQMHASADQAVSSPSALVMEE